MPSQCRLLHPFLPNLFLRLLLLGTWPWKLALLHLVRLFFSGPVRAEVVEADKVAAGRLGQVQLQRGDLVVVPAPGGGQLLVLVVGEAGRLVGLVGWAVDWAVG